MSFVGMKERYDDKTILYVKTFPGIRTMAALQNIFFSHFFLLSYQSIIFVIRHLKNL